ncbi:hypothetical protein MUN89_16160 [Halobacillus salinarum]|uniref:Uncharacterized protein n=1 Tax=Halobacillus salinarum TaxID=2932257 RepID=A0ABY4EG48_9BACI|nr:hypothetical protein [Halobacillus salinarum]UOQ43440.1 hypothetical protein MUN89_16160 [Halobacillus salinarum]
MWKWLLFLTGFGFSVVGGTVTITYLNLVPAGLGWWEFLILIQSRVECYLLPAGLMMITLAIMLMKN